jgi:hypothetical protein
MELHGRISGGRSGGGKIAGGGLGKNNRKRFRGGGSEGMMRRQGIVFGCVTLLRACGGLGSMSRMRGMGQEHCYI